MDVATGRENHGMHDVRRTKHRLGVFSLATSEKGTSDSCTADDPSTSNHEPYNNETAAADWWLTSMQLLAVQPACLKLLSQPHVLLQQPPPLWQHKPENNKLLLHLQANVQPDEPHKQKTAKDVGRTGGSVSSQTATETATAAAAAAYMLPSARSALADAMALAPPARSGCSVLPAALPLGSAVLKLAVLSPSLQIVHQHSMSLFELWQQQQQLLTTAPVAGTGTISSGSSQRCVCFHVSVSLPPPPSSQRSIDTMYVILTVQQQQAKAVEGHRPTLVAEVPLLLMPAAAQQEVQQLLLPAMRQDAQAAVTAQQQRQLAELAPSSSPSPWPSADLAWQVMGVEHAAWRHFAQLAADIQVVIRLAEEVTWEAAAAAAAAATHAAVMAHLRVSHVRVTASAGNASQQRLKPGCDCRVSSAAALEQLAKTLLFPLLLPFLAAHGLYDTLQLVVGCLPAHLQQQWQRQQLSRLQALLAAEAAQGNTAWQQARPTPSAAISISDGGALELAPDQAAKPEPGAPCAGKPGQGQQLQDQEQQQAGSEAAGSESHTSTAIVDTDTVKARAGAAAAGDSSAVGVPWHLPFTQFADDDLELRYVAWKHRALLHLDYFAAAFGSFYLVALLKRLLSEGATLFYVLYIVIKLLPHVPLMLGFREQFLRHRESWLSLIGPAYLILLIVMEARSAVLLQARPALLTAGAIKAYSTGRGELVTGSMRAFTQHMRLRPYIIYTLGDTLLSVLVLGRVYGFVAAANRWGTAAAVSILLSWAFELYMRRLFVANQQQLPVGQQQKQQQKQQQQQKSLGHVCAAEVKCAAAAASSDKLSLSLSKCHED